MFYFTLFYILFSFLLIYPPIEFISAGLTIPQLFSKFLGSENEKFLQYHIIRITVTIFVHSCLPLGYIIGLVLSRPEYLTLLWSDSTSFWWQLLLASSITGPLIAGYKVLDWSKDSWINNPVYLKIAQFASPNIPWTLLVSNINAEFRRVDKVSIQTNPTTKVVVTDNWIIKVGLYELNFAHQNECTLIVNKSDTHQISVTTGGEMQFINIEVKSIRNYVPVFNVRLNSLDFKDFQDKVLRPIIVLPSIVFHKTLIDKFIEVFKEQVKCNEKYYTTQEIESCIGCMQTASNVKLNKLCISESQNDQPAEPRNNPCSICNCRPMWCADCMARWYASRQDPDHTDKWLSSKCSCPVCRATFCLLDVSYIEVLDP